MRVNFFAATCALLFELGLTSAVYNTGSDLSQMQDFESMQMAQTWTALDLEAQPGKNGDKAKADAEKKKAEAMKAKAKAQTEQAKAKVKTAEA